MVTNLTNFNGTYKFNVYRKNTKLPYDGPPKFQNAINEIQSMVIFIFKKERHQTLTKKSHSEKESLWRLITHCVSLTVSLMNVKRVKNVELKALQFWLVCLKLQHLLYSLKYPNVNWLKLNQNIFWRNFINSPAIVSEWY